MKNIFTAAASVPKSPYTPGIENLVERGIMDDRDVDYLEHLQVQEVSDDVIATEGVVRAVLHGAGSVYTDAYREIKGWVLGVESKRKYIEEICTDLIDWLKDKDSDHRDLDLDMGTIKTWFKSNEFYTWRYYFLLEDSVWSQIESDLKKDNVTDLEGLYDIDFKARKEASRKLTNANNIKDLIKVVEQYRDRSNKFFELILKRKKKVKSFPFQVILLGATDLRRTTKNIVNMAI